MVDAREDLERDALLSEDEAHRLLARAVELDARHRASVSVEDLRKAAGEAGIESGAFIQALSELRSGALEPVTIGERISAKLAGYRRPAALAAFVAAAGITPGDAVGLTMLLGFGLHGVFEGVTALTRLLGRTHPRIPPSSPRHDFEVDRLDHGGHPEERNDMRFVLLARRLVGRGLLQQS
jgi:hypothetical protein